ncbi:hypothetical protein OV203_20360 [Nannocystis sp. ILAH1]|uniref:hypothetical protein n=1 Tax=Nannocystis sp. ILAH1 TaxID=2996789 RepID=UPI00226D8F60|nr:hypothetical protein [Nannocystis sp. ILAH1]MCY0989505.1 hypothetical protein [Nannocystis sp. ILAH1]
MSTRFEVVDLRRVVRLLPERRAIEDALPGDAASKGAVVAAFVDATERLGLCHSEALWVYLVHARPRQVAAIDAIRRRCRGDTIMTEETSAVVLLGSTANAGLAAALARRLADAGIFVRHAVDPHMRDLTAARLFLVGEWSAGAPFLAEQVCRALWERGPLWALAETRTDWDPQLEYLLSLAPRVPASPDALCERILASWPDPGRERALTAKEWRQLLDLLAEGWSSPQSLFDLAERLGLPAPPRGARGRGGIHWLLLRLLDSRCEATLRRLALAVDATDGCEAAVELLRHIARCLRESPLPDEIEWIGCWLHGESDSLSVEVFGARPDPTQAPVSARIHGAASGARIVLDASLELEVTVLGSRARVRVRGDVAGPLVGVGMRVWSGVRSLANLLLPPAGDRMGDDLLFSEDIELEG